MLLGAIPPEQFLADYWQQKPLLIRAALPAFKDPIDADDLAGLALEEEVESRLVTRSAENTGFRLRHGPFTTAQLQQLGTSDWTLLIQAVDQWIEAVADLRDLCSFLPAWRLDDVMVSYAVPGGGVGPHFDQYDVFLLQGQGSRLWRIGSRCDSETPQFDNGGLHNIAEFTALQEYTVHRGDVLYLPPGVAHWGVAESPSLTYSLGFRAPSHKEILAEWSHKVADSLADQLRYTDPPLHNASGSSIIDPAVLERLQNILHHYVNDRETLAEWFGCWVTEGRAATDTATSPGYSDADLEHDLQRCAQLRRNLTTRLALSQLHNRSTLFVNGEPLAITATSVTFAELICARQLIGKDCLSPYLKNSANRHLLVQLIASGSFELI